MVEKRSYTVRFPHEDAIKLEELAKEAGLTKTELIKDAINFYKLVIYAKKKGKRIVLEDEKTGVRELVIVL